MPLAWADTERLTGGRLRRLPPEVCVFIVFFVSGFWHGSTAPFVLWGLLQALYRVGEELLHRRLGKPKRKAPARVLWAKRAGVFALWTLSMVFFRMGSGTGTVGDCFGYLGGLAAGLAPARFAAELYSVAYNGFYANGLMVGAYYAFAALALVLGVWLDARRCFGFRNAPAEETVAALPRGRRLALYLGLVAFILTGYIMQGGGFGGSAGFGLYANY